MIKLTVPSGKVDAVRSWIYGFLSKYESLPDDFDSAIFITVFPAGEQSEYRLIFPNEKVTAAFLNYSPPLDTIFSQSHQSEPGTYGA